MSTDSESSQQPDSPKPNLLRILSSHVKFTGGNTVLHRLVLDHSHPNDSGSDNYVNAVMLSMSDVPSSVVNALNDDGYSALHLAVSKNDLTMVKKLLSCLVHVDVDARCGRDDRNTALHLAVKSGHASIVRELFSKGAGIAVRNSAEETALRVAMRLRDLDIVKILVSADVNQPTTNGTPLHEAACYGSLEIVEFLIDRGAGVGARDGNGATPLHVAAERGNADIVKLLVCKGADLQATDEEGTTPLHLAALFGHLECAEYLIDRGADVETRNANGATPLYEAVYGGNVDIAKLLTGKGADVHVTDEEGRTPLHFAVFGNKLGCAAFLLDQGANSNAADVDGWTPLHAAAYNGHLDVVKALLDTGAHANAKNGRGKTPLDLARERQKQRCIDVLENVR